VPHVTLHSNTNYLLPWWQGERSIETLRLHLKLQLPLLNKKTKKKYRHFLSTQIKAAVAARENSVHSLRLKLPFASLLGTRKELFRYDVLQRGDGTQAADPIEIHRIFQRHFHPYFSTDPDSLMQQLGLDLPLGGID
jgi:hypothetical protein